MAQILDVLERTPLFADVEPVRLAQMLLDCRLRTPRRGDRIFSAREPAESLYVVATGRIKLTTVAPDGREHLVEIMRAGDVIALMPVMEEGVYPVNGTALTDAALVRIPAGAFRRLCDASPPVRERALKEVGARLRTFRRRLEELSTRTVVSRVAGHILRLAEESGGDVDVGAVVDLGGTREMVAESLGTVREVLTRQLRRMEKEGVVALRGRRVELRDPPRLRLIAAG